MCEREKYVCGTYLSKILHRYFCLFLFFSQHTHSNINPPFSQFFTLSRLQARQSIATIRIISRLLFPSTENTLTHVLHLRTILLNGARSFCRGNVITPNRCTLAWRDSPTEKNRNHLSRKRSRYKNISYKIPHGDHRLMSQKTNVFFESFFLITVLFDLSEHMLKNHTDRVLARARNYVARLFDDFRHKFNKKRQINWTDGRNGRKRAGWYGDEEEEDDVVDGWLDRRPARGVRSCSTWPPDWVSPTLGTFVNPFVRLILISPSQLRRTTTAFLRARRLSHTSPADLSHAYLFFTASLLLLPSVSLPPLSFFFPHSFSWTQRSIRLCTTVEVTRYCCFPLAHSRVRSSPSFQLFVSYFVLRCLSALRSSLSTTIQLQPDPLARSRDSPATEETTHVCTLPSLSNFIHIPLLLDPAVSYADSWQRILFRSIIPRSSVGKLQNR